MKFKLALLPLVCLFSTTLSGCVDDKINSLNEMDSYLQEQIDSLNNEIKDLKDQIKKLREEMEAASQALQDDYNAKIAKIEEETEALKTELQELTDQFNADKEALTNDYNTKINNLQTFINEKIEELNARIKEDEDALKALETKHDNDKAALEADYNTKITNLTSSFNAQLAEATTDYNTKLAALEAKHNEDKQALIDDYTAKIAALAQTDSEGRTALQNEFNTKLTALETKHNNDKAALETDYNTKLATLEGKLETAKEELKADYNAKITALDENYANQVLNLQTQITANKNSIDTFKSQYLTGKAALELDYNTKITNLRTTYENKVLEIEQSILEKGNAITALETEMNEALLNLQNDYNAKINALTTRVATLETKTYHTVTFDTLGGSHIEPVLVEHGEKVAKPVNPAKDGYAFDGWFYQGEPWVFFGYVVTEDITLSAKWTTINYSITYNLNGATSFDYESNPSTYTIEDAFTFTNPSKTGYSFLGWYDDSSTQITSISVGTTGDLVLNARWNEGNAYTITLNPNGGEVSETSIEVQYDHAYSLPTPTHPYASFDGWYYEANLINNTGDWTIDSNITLFARWNYDIEPSKENATLEEVFADNSGNGAKAFHIENAEIYAFCDRDQNPSIVPLAHGYALLGENGEYFAWGMTASDDVLSWNNETGKYNYSNPNDFLTNPVTQNITAHTHVDMDVIRCDYMGIKEINCVITAIRYSITYNLNGATSFDDEANPSTYTPEDEIIFTSPEKKGYTFLGWYDNNDNQVLSIPRGSTGNKEITAHWSEANSYTVTLNPNGGEVPETSIEVQYDHIYSLPTPTHNDANFIGWKYGNEYIGGSGTWSIDSDVTLIADWDPIIHYGLADEYAIRNNRLNGRFEVVDSTLAKMQLFQADSEFDLDIEYTVIESVLTISNNAIEDDPEKRFAARFNTSDDGASWVYSSAEGTGEALFYNATMEVMHLYDDFSEYNETGQGYYENHPDYTDLTGLKANYFSDLYDNFSQYEIQSPVGGNGWSLTGGDGNQLKLKTSDGFGVGAGGNAINANCASIKTSNSLVFRHFNMPFAKTSFDGTPTPVAPVIGKFSHFSIMAKGSPNANVVIKIAAYYRNDIGPETQSTDRIVSDDITIDMGSGWKEYAISLNNIKTYYGFAIIVRMGAVAYFSIDNICFYNGVSPYAINS